MRNETLPIIVFETLEFLKFSIFEQPSKLQVFGDFGLKRCASNFVEKNCDIKFDIHMSNVQKRA
jgi:hypothetical protein